MSKTAPALLLALAAGLLLAGCSGSSTPTSAPKAKAKTAAATSVKTPWDPLLKDEAKAKNVQNVLNQAAKKKQKKIEQATQ